VAEAPNYHINIWPEPPGPSTYLCLLCPLADTTEAEIQAHVTTEHGVAAVPTPIAANPPVIATPSQEETPDAPKPDVPHRDQ
jgi:hypothetical protein